jgi:hypothetical protein
VIVLVALIGWVVLSVPFALVLGAMFRAGSPAEGRPPRVVPARAPVRVFIPSDAPGVRH